MRVIMYIFKYTVISQRLQHKCQHPEDGEASLRRAASLSISSFSVFVSLCVSLRVLCLMLCFVCLCVSGCVWSKRNESECLDMCTCNRQ